MKIPGGTFDPTATVLTEPSHTAAADRVLPIRGTGAATAPEFYFGPVRRGASDRTTRPRMSSREDELKGESNESVVKGGIGLQTFAGRGRGEYTAMRS